MFVISRERPTFQKGAYLEVRVPRHRDYLTSVEVTVKNGVHYKYIPESDCDGCGTYQADEDVEMTEWDFSMCQSSFLDTYYLILLKGRTQDGTSTDNGG